MPTDYAPRSKPMHTREVRYERNDRFLGKRDWQRVAVFERSPALSSSNGGSYDPPSKRRPSGRHGFSGENGRFREHSSSRASENQPMFSSAPSGFTGFGHKPERYVLPGGGMTHCPGSSSSGRNGLRDGGGEDDFFRERDCERLVSSSPSPAQPLHPYNSVVYDAHPGDGHRGSRYGWDVHSRGEREHHATTRERFSSSPDVLDRRNGGGSGGVSRFGWSDAPERELEGRLDRYGASRDPDGRIRELPAEEVLDPFVSPRFQQSQHQRGGFSVPASLLQEERVPLPPSSPPKKTRLKWGEGLARYEQKNTSRARSHEEEPAPATSNGCAEQEQARGFESKGDANGSLPSSDRDLTPSREHTPTPAPSGVSDKVVCGTDHPIILTCETMATAAPRSPSIPLTTPRSPSIPFARGNEECALSPQPREAEETHDPPAQTLQQQEEEPRLSKEAVLLQVERVELEIESIEKELASLAVQTDAPQPVQPDLEEQPCSTKETETAVEIPEEGNPDTDVVMVDAAQQPEDQPESQSGNLPGELPEVITDRCLEDFGHILPQGFVRGRKVYSSPQETEVWIRNEELHRLNKDRILEKMLNKKNLQRFKERSLVLKYRLLRDRYGTRKGDAATDGRNGFTQRLPQKLRLPDDQQWLRVVSEPVRQYRETERMPSMILCQGERSAQYIVQSNRRVEDPIEFEQERKSINPWTPEEKKLFLDKFALFYKNFAKIASFLQHKTTGDCVEFYYRNQKTEEFQKLRKKQQLKKRHSRASYLATTTPAASGRLRDYNAASAVAKVTPGKETSSGNVSSIVTGVCSLSSDAPLTPLRGPCERALLREEHSIKQKGVRSSRSRREQVEEAESEWTDTERELFLDAVLLFGKDFKSIAVHVRSKNEGQCKTFYSKARKRLKLDRIVEQHQLAQEMSATTTQQLASVTSPDGGSFPSNASNTVQARSSTPAAITPAATASASINSEITTEPTATIATPGVQAGETMSKTPLSRSSDVKLFGQSLLSHPPTMSLTATTAAKPEPCDSTSRGVPFLLGESWCSGSAEAQDREFAARCRSLAAVSSGGGIYRLDQNGGFSGALPEAASKLPDGVVDWQQLAATREPLDLWKGEVMKPSFVAGFCQSSQQQQSQQQQHQHPKDQQQEQQQQPQQQFLMQFPANWSSSSGSDPLHARILAQFSDQQQLHQQLQQHQRQCLCNRCHCCYCCC
ncbi:uncharacterized protein LOC9660995 isoform X1 [Selaginella moellendorffii]|nr:uncharacterized protein LOC9660995 isoform X1 [Selaginella moellendorffii]|eukprot:XP_024517706.1 uncharacterized protein LOC9660995 isoform X1 [Selaginella moellendorffii]